MKVRLVIQTTNNGRTYYGKFRDLSKKEIEYTKASMTKAIECLELELDDGNVAIVYGHAIESVCFEMGNE